jgi:hypothetical protein
MNERTAPYSEDRRSTVGPADLLVSDHPKESAKHRLSRLSWGSVTSLVHESSMETSELATSQSSSCAEPFYERSDMGDNSDIPVSGSSSVADDLSLDESRKSRDSIMAQSSDDLPKPSTKPRRMSESRALLIISRFLCSRIKVIRAAKDSKRRSIVRELIETERHYVDSLIICEEVYFKPLSRSISSKSPLIDTSTLVLLFGNLDQIRETHQYILHDLDILVANFKTAFPDSESYLRVASTFSAVLIKLEQLYTDYLRSNKKSADILKRMNKNKRFKEFCSECLFDPRSKCQEIEDLLILPTQRIAGYKLLFQRLLRYFPQETHESERRQFTVVYESLLKIGASMNDVKDCSSSAEKLLNIAESVSQIPPFMCILAPGREYVGSIAVRMIDGQSGKRGKRFCIYITSDILVVARRHDSGIFASQSFVDAIPVTQVRFSAFPIDKYIDKAFEMKTDIQTYSFWAKSSEVRDHFITTIKRVKKKIQAQVTRQDRKSVV